MDTSADTAMAPAGIDIDRQVTAQQPSQIMAGQVAAEAGVNRFSTPVSMSILDLVMLDHNCMRAMYEAYKSPGITLENRQLLAWEMIMALSTHAAKEELVVYPVIRSTLGADAADHLTGEHQTLKTMLATLDTMSAADPNFDMQLRASLDSMIAHMQEEEATFLPQLSAVLDVDTQISLGIRFEAAKVRAPTRPHPEVVTTALPAPFAENQLAATKLVDASLDQARFPSVAPTAVGLSPLASAAIINSAGLTTPQQQQQQQMPLTPPPPQSEGLPAVPPPPVAAGGGGGAGGDLVDLVDLGDDDDDLMEPGEAGVGGNDGLLDIGVAGVVGADAEGGDAEGAAGGMPGDLTGGAGAGGAAGGGGGDFAEDVGGTNVEQVKEVPPQQQQQELAPAGVEV